MNTESDLAAKRARDDANNRGAEAWSPSRAREALRAELKRQGRKAWRWISRAESEGALEEASMFYGFCALWGFKGPCAEL